MHGHIWYIVFIYMCLTFIQAYTEVLLALLKMDTVVLEISRKLAMETIHLEMVINDEEHGYRFKNQERNLDTRIVSSCQGTVAGVLF